jgi:hypothetical protein
VRAVHYAHAARGDLLNNSVMAESLADHGQESANSIPRPS